MNIEEKVKKDKALAYFLGWRIDNSFPDKGKVWRKGNAVELETTFKFSTDWNALMEVCEKVNKIDRYSVEITPSQCRIFINANTRSVIVGSVYSTENTIDAVYKCLSSFVLVYNKEQICKDAS